jgi:hypothetical protein
VILVDTIPWVFVGLALENMELSGQTSLESSHYQGATRQKWEVQVRSTRKGKLSRGPRIGRHSSESSIGRVATSFVLCSNSHPRHSCYQSIVNGVERMLICRFGVLDFRNHILASMVVCARGSRNAVLGARTNVSRAIATL